MAANHAFVTVWLFVVYRRTLGRGRAPAERLFRAAVREVEQE